MVRGQSSIGNESCTELPSQRVEEKEQLPKNQTVRFWKQFVWGEKENASRTPSNEAPKIRIAPLLSTISQKRQGSSPQCSIDHSYESRSKLQNSPDFYCVWSAPTLYPPKRQSVALMEMMQAWQRMDDQFWARVCTVALSKLMMQVLFEYQLPVLPPQMMSSSRLALQAVWKSVRLLGSEACSAAERTGSNFQLKQGNAIIISSTVDCSIALHCSISNNDACVLIELDSANAN